MGMRLQKYIAMCGYASRRKAEELIKAGHVKVNNGVIKEMGYIVKDNDIVFIDDQKVLLDEKKVYYLLNKPRGVICSSNDDKGRKTVIDLIETDKRIYSVGRLEYDTTGLLILTNDGELTNILTHPKYEVLKTYLAKIEGVLTKEDIAKIKYKMVVDGRRVKVDHFKIKQVDKDKKSSLVEITISEGRNHIVKKIFASVRHEVIRLSRIRYGFLELGNLKSGEYRELSLKEVKKLYSLK